MEREVFKVHRRYIARQIYDALIANPPKGSTAVHEPDDLGSVGVDFGDVGYILINTEDSDG